MQKQNQLSLSFLHEEENKETNEQTKRFDKKSWILWGLFYLLMYKVIFVEILNLDVFAMVK